VGQEHSVSVIGQSACLRAAAAAPARGDYEFVSTPAGATQVGAQSCLNSGDIVRCTVQVESDQAGTYRTNAQYRQAHGQLVSLLPSPVALTWVAPGSEDAMADLLTALRAFFDHLFQILSGFTWLAR
jgi:hypothetical protein